MKAKIITLITLMVFALVPVTSLSADMWCETPDVFDECPVSGSAAFNYDRPAVDLWAETPDLNAEGNTYELILEAYVHFNGNVNPEMYLETPDLNTITLVEKAKQDDRTPIAKK